MKRCLLECAVCFSDLGCLWCMVDVWVHRHQIRYLAPFFVKMTTRNPCCCLLYQPERLSIECLALIVQWQLWRRLGSGLCLDLLLLYVCLLSILEVYPSVRWTISACHTHLPYDSTQSEHTLQCTLSGAKNVCCNVRYSLLASMQSSRFLPFAWCNPDSNGDDSSW